MHPPSSPEALYHAISQDPEEVNSSEINLAPSSDDEYYPTDPPDIVVDRLIKIVHFILGCAVLLPWNVMITATPFFLSRVVGSPFETSFGSYLSTSFTLSNFLFLAHATATSKQMSPARQTRWTIFGIAILTFLLTLSTYVVVNPNLFFAFVALNGIAQAALGSYLQTAVIAVASLFGPQAVQAMIFGQGAVAVAVSGVQLLSSAGSVWNLPEDAISTWVSDGSAEERSAFIFFALSTIFLVGSAIAHHWLIQSPLYDAVAAPLERQHGRSRSFSGELDERRALTSRSVKETWSEEKSRLVRVAKGNITYEVAVSYVFMATLAVFPAITTSIQPVNPTIHPLLFSAIHFFVFNVGDFFGRYLCAFPSLIVWGSKRLLVFSLARTLFIPLFLMCNLQRPATPSPLTPAGLLIRAADVMLRATPSTQPPAINSDFVFFLLLSVFGLTNGYVSSLCMMSVASLEHNPFLRERQRVAGAKKAKEEVDVCATVASFCLVVGLVLGSAGSFAVRAAVCNCNPFLS